LSLLAGHLQPAHEGDGMEKKKDKGGEATGRQAPNMEGGLPQVPGNAMLPVQDILGLERLIDKDQGYNDTATGLPMVQNYTACRWACRMGACEDT